MDNTQRVKAIGFFFTSQEAKPALQALKDSGLPMDQVSILAKQTDEGETEDLPVEHQIGDKDVDSVSDRATNAVNNATWGTLLVGLTSLSLFGAGPILAAGTLGAAMITGVAGAGAEAVGVKGLVKALTERGIPEKDASFYIDRLVQGNYLVIIDGTEDDANRAGDILGQHGIHTWNVYSAVNV